MEKAEPSNTTSEFLASVVFGFLMWLPVAVILTPSFVLVYWLAGRAWGGLDQFAAAALAAVLTFALNECLNRAFKR